MTLEELLKIIQVMGKAKGVSKEARFFAIQHLLLELKFKDE